MSFQRLSEGVEGKSRPLEFRWKVVPQSRTGGRETHITEFVMCSRHEQLPHACVHNMLTIFPNHFLCQILFPVERRAAGDLVGDEGPAARAASPEEVLRGHREARLHCREGHRRHDVVGERASTLLEDPQYSQGPRELSCAK